MGAHAPHNTTTGTFEAVAVGLDQDASIARPLCVDLDGTLVQSDMLVEGVFAAAASPVLYRAVLRLRDGNRAAFKQTLARRAALDAAILPYNPALLDYIRQQRAAGRRIVLVTAADRAIADAVASHLGLFDEVMASDGTRNLKGRHKAEALVARFGRGGFSYAGDSSADLAVWKHASSAVLVGTSRRVAAEARALVQVEAEFQGGGNLAALLHAMRPHQWLKNLLVVVPLFVSGAPLTTAALLACMLTGAAFCATASGIYIINDLTDLAADRRHPRKRRRPFASGAASPLAGLALATVLLLVGGVLAASAGVLLLIGLYAAVSLAYSLRLKELPLVDVFVLAALYVLRLFSGGEATGQRVSFWLLAFSSFLFLSLALVKRVGELTATAGRGTGFLARCGYHAADVPILQMFGASASVAAAVVLALFIQSEGTAERYPSPALLWGMVPLVLFWQFRIWLSTARGYMQDDPIVYAARDRVSWATALAALLLMAAARVLHVV